ncbi:MAG: hypothetical protein C0478_15070 [Planctomyces sp.]|nr:hypothetical protein [Planctomyces sp.]
MIERTLQAGASFHEFSGGILLPTISAEDVVVMKTLAGRDQDWIDVKNVVVQGDRLDIEAIDQRMESICELYEHDETWDRWREIKDRYAPG